MIRCASRPATRLQKTRVLIGLVGGCTSLVASPSLGEAEQGVGTDEHREDQNTEDVHG